MTNDKVFRDLDLLSDANIEYYLIISDNLMFKCFLFHLACNFKNH